MDGLIVGFNRENDLPFVVVYINSKVLNQLIIKINYSVYVYIYCKYNTSYE